jgi:hypothetical protein
LPNISDFNGVPLSSISSVDGIAKASIGGINGVDFGVVYDLNVFLVAGQSNSVGRNAYASGPVYLQSGIVPDVNNYNGQNTIYDLNSGIFTGRDGVGNGNFAFNHVAMYQIAQELNDIVSVSVCVGDTILYASNYGNGSYNADYDSIPTGSRRLLEELEIKYSTFENWATSKNLTFKVRGLIWHQGESDGLVGGLAASTYGTNWAALVAKVRSFTGEAQLPIFYGTIPAASLDYDVTIRNAMLNYAAGDANAYCRDNDDLTMFDSVHFDSASSEVFGDWVYTTWLAQN